MTYDTHGRPDSSPPEAQSSTSDNPPSSSSDGNSEKNIEKLKASFPIQKLRSLTQKISNPRWVVPVLPEQELECLLNAAIELTIAGNYLGYFFFLKIYLYIYNLNSRLRS